MNDSPSQRKETEERDDFNFQDIFSEADDAFSRRSPMVESLAENLAKLLTRCAIAKCLDFNIEANNTGDDKICPFFLIGNTRAICEDLIYSIFFRKIGNTQSENIALGILQTQHLKSILAQTKFFPANNRLQLAIGGTRLPAQQEQDIADAEIHLKDLWKQQGFDTFPSIKRLASKVGLETTYGYVYHMSSNFVHFNPNQLLRLGWGAEDGPFIFSVRHFEKYYLDVSRFLGAIVFFGYCCAFSNMFERSFPEKYIKCVTSRLESSARWPEIITFEEMNQEFPNILVRAAANVMRDDATDGFSNILSELKSLQNMS